MKIRRVLRQPVHERFDFGFSFPAVVGYAECCLEILPPVEDVLDLFGRVLADAAGVREISLVHG